MPAQSAHPVLLIPEILEQILTHVSAIDVLIYRRVCRTWNEVVADSPKLDFYTRTGLPYSRKKNDKPKCKDRTDFTPLAIEVLSRLWRKIVSHGAIGQHPHDSILRFLKTTAKSIYHSFQWVVTRVALIHPALEGLSWEGRFSMTNWVFRSGSVESPESSHEIYRKFRTPGGHAPPGFPTPLHRYITKSADSMVDFHIARDAFTRKYVPAARLQTAPTLINVMRKLLDTVCWYYAVQSTPLQHRNAIRGSLYDASSYGKSILIYRIKSMGRKLVFECSGIVTVHSIEEPDPRLAGITFCGFRRR
ncbi:hypothetical protein ABW19_dt0201011 [Dactylella cylindrospora]|nr:hypothetical protein ABW19_dt0201011 [Dactylella cylindrospora]